MKKLNRMDNRAKRKYLLLRILKIAAIAATVMAVLLIGYVAVQISSVPDISSVDATPEGFLTTILDAEGKRVDSLYMSESNRVYVTMDQIPEDLQHAFVAIEDSRFYKHHGIDPKGILRAFVRGIMKGGFSEGASTITQQLLKNNVLVTWTDEKTFMDRVNRKIKEQNLALQLEKQYDKEWILRRLGV